MSPTRRRAALGLMAAGAAVASARPVLAQATPELTDADAPATRLATVQSKYEHMLAPVQINGQGPFRFLLDTGANISCVSQRLAERLDLKSSETRAVHTVVGVRHRPLVTLDHLQIGPRNRRNVKAPALPIKGDDVDGVLGVDWLKDQRLVLDFRGRRMEITRSQPDQGEAGRIVVVPARRKYGQLTIVDADLGGAKISAILDSGAQGTLCNSALRNLVREQERRTSDRIPRLELVQMETLAGETFVGEALFLPFLRLGGLHIGNVQVTCADMHVFNLWGLKDKPALVIGIDLLSQFEQVALDFGRSQVRFDFI